ncbi:four-carbon acid sugar kinase family protein [uncultured Clostridium sp.]|uniref:four-carbon acid sugar kinase family protein n=1 Tax=uncultured Clostridium sp. TaxID=59620 RepID=UPI00345AC72E
MKQLISGRKGNNMVKLLIIADDFTGALDTGVQFAAGGAETRVVTNTEYNFDSADGQVQVLVLDAETRHLSREEAYQVVFHITERAYKSGIPFIYKKTDSALRGNVGSELKAVLDATGQTSLQFLPAFPKMNRVTRNGIHYIDGIPVHESVFGKDPFEPVLYSGIPEIIGKDVPSTVVRNMKDWSRVPGIMIYDTSTEAEMEEQGKFLMKKDELHIMAGCAGFAGVLPSLLGLEGSGQRKVAMNGNFLVACGSVNPITRKQLDYAEKHGFKRIRMTPEQKLKAGYYQTPEGKAALLHWKDICSRNACSIIDTNDLPGQNETLQYAKEQGITMEELRVRISSTLGYVVKELIQMGLDTTLLITGGDCLTGFMKHIGREEIAPVCEMAPGTVLSGIEIGDKTFAVISKSGGFGSSTLMADLAGIITGNAEETRQDKKEEKKYVNTVYA